MRIPEYRTKVDVAVDGNNTLERGSFVKPVQWGYLPRHIQEDWELYRNDTTYTMCYTALGFLLISTDKIEVAEY